MSAAIHVSMLARCSQMGSKSHMGTVTPGTFHVDGVEFFRSLVKDSTSTVAKLTEDPSWPTDEARIVADLAKIAAADAPESEKKVVRDEIKALIPAIVPGRFVNDVRSKATCVGRQVIGHDFDHMEAESFETACDTIRAKLPGRFLAIHTTPTERNPDGTWRLRVYEILDREASPEEWEARVKPHMRSLGEHDEAALDVARLLYVPVQTAGYRFAVFDGEPTALDSLAAEAPSTVTVTAAAPAERTATTPNARRAAMAAALGAAWPPDGHRREAHMALAGALRSEGFAESEAVDFLCDVYRNIGEDKRSASQGVVRSTYSRPADAPITGWSRLKAHVDPVVVDTVRSALDKNADFVERTTRRLAEVGAGGAAVTEVAAATPKTWPSIATRISRAEKYAFRLATGIPILDSITRGGIPPGKTVILGGAPGAAKTGTLVSIAHYCARNGAYVAFLAADEDADSIWVRLGQLEGFDRAKLEDRDPETKAALLKKLHDLRFELADGDEEDVSLEDMADDLAGRANGAPAFLGVDSIQTLRAQGTSDAGSLRERVDAVMKAMRRAAKRHKIVVFGTSELARGAYRSKDSAEQIDDLAAFKESGGIEYGATVALVLRSRKDTPDLIDVSMPKNRLGQKQKFALRWDFERARASEAPVSDEPPKTTAFDLVEQFKERIVVLLKGAPTGLSREQLISSMPVDISRTKRRDAIDAAVTSLELANVVASHAFRGGKVYTLIAH